MTPSIDNETKLLGWPPRRGDRNHRIHDSAVCLSGV